MLQDETLFIREQLIQGSSNSFLGRVHHLKIEGFQIPQYTQNN